MTRLPQTEHVNTVYFSFAADAWKLQAWNLQKRPPRLLIIVMDIWATVMSLAGMGRACEWRAVIICESNYLFAINISATGWYIQKSGTMTRTCYLGINLSFWAGVPYKYSWAVEVGHCTVCESVQASGWGFQVPRCVQWVRRRVKWISTLWAGRLRERSECTRVYLSTNSQINEGFQYTCASSAVPLVGMHFLLS